MSESVPNMDWNAETDDDTVQDILSTGIDVLDRKLGGGVPPGAVIALSASPRSQSELFLYAMATVRETMYLTSERTAEEVEHILENQHDSTEDITVHPLPANSALERAASLIEEMPTESTLIIDPIGPLEASPEVDYRVFLNAVKKQTRETGSMTLLHCLDGRHVPTQRDRTEYLSDVIFDLITNLRGDSLENKLSIPKFRHGRARNEAIQLDLAQDVTIDVSRKIA